MCIRDSQISHAVERAFVDGDAVGDGAGRVVDGFLRREFRVQAALVRVGLIDLVPGAGDLHAIGYVAGLEAGESVERGRVHHRIAAKLHAAQMVDRTRIDGQSHDNL